MTLLISVRKVAHDIRERNTPMSWLWPIVGNPSVMSLSGSNGVGGIMRLNIRGD